MVTLIQSRGADPLETRKQGKSRLHPHLENCICTYVCKTSYECVAVWSMRDWVESGLLRLSCFGKKTPRVLVTNYLLPKIILWKPVAG